MANEVFSTQKERDGNQTAAEQGSQEALSMSKLQLSPTLKV